MRLFPALALIQLALASCAGPSTPSDVAMPVPTPPPFAPPVVPTTTMRLEGQIFGRFVLEEDFRGRAWDTVELGVTRDGYEPTPATVTPAATDLVLRLYPTLTHRPGERLETHLFLDTYHTPWDGYVARRVAIDASPGEPIQVDLIPLDHPYIGLTTLSAFQEPGDHGFQDTRTRQPSTTAPVLRCGWRCPGSIDGLRAP